jgi:hypothetical protein
LGLKTGLEGAKSPGLSAQKQGHFRPLIRSLKSKSQKSFLTFQIAREAALKIVNFDLLKKGEER